MSGWVTLWDVAAEPFRWGEAGEGLWVLSALAIGASGASALRRRSAVAAGAVVAVAVAVSGAVLWRSFQHQREHAACVLASRQDRGRVLEGVVRDHRPLTSYWQRPAQETFTLAGEPVRLPLVPDGCGYHLTSLEGSGLRDGLRVRVRAWQGQILRLEMDRDALLGSVGSGRIR